jgi:hypothetical protein
MRKIAINLETQKRNAWRSLPVINCLYDKISNLFYTFIVKKIQIDHIDTWPNYLIQIALTMTSHAYCIMNFWTNFKILGFRASNHKTLHMCYFNILRNTRGRRCTSGGFLKIASWYTRAGLRGIVGWSREEIEILIFVTSHR